MNENNFWKGKRVFLTGHTGFKGSWLSIWLNSMGCIVRGYALLPPSSPSLYTAAKVEDLIDSQIGDIRNYHLLYEAMNKFNPDIVFHMAAQSLVRKSYSNPIETYEVNIIGTANVLEAARSCENLKVVINITTDKCYENEDFDKSFKETDPMGGYDPYSSSKGCAEIITSAYRRSFYNELGIGLASARAGNVIGGGDWAKDRLIPDILRSFEDKKPVLIRSPNATRPWQHVLEPLSGYLKLAKEIYFDSYSFSEGWNFGPKDSDIKTVEWIIDKMSSKWPNSSWKIDDNPNPHESSFLKLDISKAKLKLDWTPTWQLNFALEKIINWHFDWLENKNMQEVCIAEIKEYMMEIKHEIR
ncbi:CDP-glucose 4,6-dehydratase [Pseudothioglobus sp. nBUS_23]|uniref:CDP-glucose 4,6-dehydratase n=1 Tax=Pseudothioglobus sp. nBUS_23 TaxID=3395318 RepID=UPI003EB9745E